MSVVVPINPRGANQTLPPPRSWPWGLASALWMVRTHRMWSLTNVLTNTAKKGQWQCECIYSALWSAERQRHVMHNTTSCISGANTVAVKYRPHHHITYSSFLPSMACGFRFRWTLFFTYFLLFRSGIFPSFFTLNQCIKSG